MKAQKHACFPVFSPFSAHFTSHYIIKDKGLLYLHVHGELVEVHTDVGGGSREFPATVLSQRLLPVASHTEHFQLLA